jgi:hypothetical protein
MGAPVGVQGRVSMAVYTFAPALGAVGDSSRRGAQLQPVVDVLPPARSWELSRGSRYMSTVSSSPPTDCAAAADRSSTVSEAMKVVGRDFEVFTRHWSRFIAGSAPLRIVATAFCPLEVFKSQSLKLRRALTIYFSTRGGSLTFLHPTAGKSLARKEPPSPLHGA